MGRPLACVAVALALDAAACAPPAREYELRGVVVAVDPSRREITIKHEDIPRFMPGMTMPFKVRDGRLLEGRVPGDLVRATLVVEESEAHLRALERTGSGRAPDAPPRASILLEPGTPVPDATFIDQDGRTRRLSDWRGRAVAVTFIYTRCPLPNFCPLMDRHFKATQDAVEQDGTLRGRIQLLSVSFDPAHDTPAVLALRARQLAADHSVWSFLTGDRDEIERFASGFGVSIVRENEPSAPAAEIVHSLRTAVIGADGRLSTILPGNEWMPRELVGELRNALGR